ncbi:MAG: tetratricopeptide repeat protein [Saprospiraceae bacterium]|nr:tetratricopeptide repeat protein [Saprospiraceae bacterium]
MTTRYIYIMLICFAGTSAFAQPFSDSEKKAEAQTLFARERFADAATLLANAKSLIRDDREARLMLAISYYQLNQLDKALEHLKAMTEASKSPYQECWLYMGKVYHARHQFEEATKYFKLYLKTIKSDHPHRQMVREEIRRCANGIELQFKTSAALVENLGPQTNSIGDEFAPVPSPTNYNKIYFSAARKGSTGGLRNARGAQDERYGQYFSDIYASRSESGVWLEPEPMHYLLNSPKHEVLLDFNREGKALLYFQGWNFENGAILVDTFRQLDARTLSADPFLGPAEVRTKYVSPFFYNDTLIIFAARLPGGFGGLDLYRISLRKGVWTAPQNLGQPINTPYDETTPFLAMDGRTLYFSSNDSYKSVGGLDVFRSVYNQGPDTWTQPMNVGIPINSASDDTHFRISRDGFTAFLCSSRKDGFGMRDIYIAYFQEFLTEMDPPQFAYEPAPTEPEPTPQKPSSKTTGNKTQGYTFEAITLANAESALSSKDKSTLDRVADLMLQYPQLRLIVSAYAPETKPTPKGLYQAVRQAEKATDFLLKKGVSPGSIFMRGMSRPRSAGGFQVEFAFRNTRDLPIQGQVPVIGNNYKSVAPGLVTNKDLVYKVQVASSKGEYGNTAFIAQPYPMAEKTPSFEFYRYTLGAFESFSEAEAFRQSILGKGFSGAYMVVYLNGERVDKDIAKQNTGVFPDLENYLNPRGN